MACVLVDSMHTAELISLLKGQQPNVVVVNNLCDTHLFCMLADKELTGLLTIVTVSQGTQYKQGLRVRVECRWRQEAQSSQADRGDPGL